MIAFRVAGDPVAKMRARVTFVGGRARAYTPAATVRWERSVAIEADRAMKAKGVTMTSSPVAVSILVNLEPPKSWPTWKRVAALDGLISATTKPDLDNLGKAILDAINGVTYADDAQVVDIRMRSRYAESPGVMVTVDELRSMAAQSAMRKSDIEGIA